jgi:hypothetical protein
MRRTTWIILALVSLYAVAALSDTPRNIVPANCKDKQGLQLLSAGEPVEGDAGKVTCTVTYWACGQRFTQTQVATNMPGACESFTNSVRSKVGREACCDCFPKCSVADAGKRKSQPPVASEPAPASTSKNDCCANVAQLQEQVKQLEARLKALEDKLSGDEVTLNAGTSTIKLKGDKAGGIAITSDQDISITSAKNVSIKASGNVILKGTKIQQN